MPERIIIRRRIKRQAYYHCSIMPKNRSFPMVEKSHFEAESIMIIFLFDILLRLIKETDRLNKEGHVTWLNFRQ